MENFFSRPLPVAHYQWVPGTSLFEVLDPWTAYFSNPRVINRICNFNALRCKLHIRVLVSGTSFNFGRAIMTYNPLQTRDYYLRDRAAVWQDLVLTSQRPHIFLDPTTSTGGDMILPFIWHENALQIPDNDWTAMGKLVLRSINVLQNANASLDPVSITVFAWAEDVHLSIPTTLEPGGMLPQSDEFGTGAISKPAAAVAKAAGSLSTIPVIAPYAKATQLAATAIAGVAQAMGMSRPQVISDTKLVRPQYAASLANTNTADTVSNLAFDCKQELTIDTRTMGLGGADEMSLKSIAAKPSYIDTFKFSTAYSTDQLLWNIRVDPGVRQISNFSTETGGLYLPACAFAALPFKYWNGTMKYRFQIASSSLHRGKLRFVYDPNHMATSEYNVNYSTIIDIGQDRDFTLEVGWGSTRPMVEVMPISTVDPPSTTAKGTALYGNGVLSVYVMNPLVTPNSDAVNDVYINVFVSAGDDIEFFHPNESALKDLTPLMAPQSLDLTDNKPDAVAPTVTLAPVSSVPQRDLVFYGDPIMSIRQLLRRYGYYGFIPLKSIWNSTATQAGQLETFHFPSFPLVRGYNNQAPYTRGTDGYNLVKYTMINYFAAAFACWRGSLRYKMAYESLGTQSSSAVVASTEMAKTIVVKRGNKSAGEPYYTNTGIPSCYTSAGMYALCQAYDALMPHGWDGILMTVKDHNPVLEFEVPFYAPVRFLSPRTPFWNSGDPSFSVTTPHTNYNYHSSGYQTFISVGEDFTLAMYLGPPLLFRSPTPTPI